MNKTKKEIGRTIREVRKERGLSQEELSKKMGFKDRSGLTKIETGVNDISGEALAQLAELLEVHVGIFLLGKLVNCPILALRTRILGYSIGEMKERLR